MFFNKMKRYQKVVDKINKLEPEIEKMSQEELIAKTREFQNNIKKIKETNKEYKKKIDKYLDEILPYAFAMVREASKRTLGMRHFDVQLIGGRILHEGCIAEMRTGEGKTLVITLPSYLNALTGDGVHVVTVNDYLAKRDKEKMEVIHNYLGLEVGLIQNQQSIVEKRENYNKDITYVTNSEVGFDYLKDNLAKTNEHKVLIKGMKYAIIDEVDSILIDEARTPLIISGQGEVFNDLYLKADQFAKMITTESKKKDESSKLEKSLQKEKTKITYEADVVVDRKEKTVHMTDKGIEKAEKFFNVDNLGDTVHSTIMHHIMQSLKANYLFVKDTDYMINDGKIDIIDEFTGRVLSGRKYSEGLHQALEAKEGVEITPENKTLASVTYQNLFRLYYKKSGLTGTGKTEEEEFLDIHGLPVIEVPTNKPIQRIDHEDKVYKTKKEKLLAIANDVKENYEKGRPVLIGTPSVYMSEVVSTILTRMKIPHQVLNAKNHALEAEIISHAGEVGAITVATNMAGRGTDIQLSDKAKELGGLKVIGVERNDSRRVDNQLRGRSGRQGDVGESIFYLSLEDDLMKLFGNGNSINTLFAMSVNYGEAIESRILTSAIQNAQKQIEGMHFSQRKNVIQYDQVISTQRGIIYSDRDKLLEGNALDNYEKLINGFVDNIVEGYEEKTCDLSIIEFTLEKIKEITKIEELDIYKKEDIEDIQEIKDYFINHIKEETKDLNQDYLNEIIKNTILNIVDEHWTNYLDVIAEIQKGAHLISFKQQDPVQEFIANTKQTFEDLIENIQVDTIKKIMLYDYSLLLPKKEEEVISE